VPAATSPFLRRHAFTLGVGVVLMVICFWMITVGTGELFAGRGFVAFYDGQADSLVHGRWDVPPGAIMGEAFVVHGKSYGYFGFTPALPRIFLNLIFPSKYGAWSRLLMLFWIASVMAAVMAFMDEFEVPPNPFVLVVAVLGSTVFFLCSYAIVYHEAIMVGAALALWAYLFFCRYLRQARLGFLAAACVLSFLSFFARFTVGAGPLMFASFLCVALLFRYAAEGRTAGWARRSQVVLDWLKFPSPAGAGKHAAFLALCLGITGATYVSVNHAKFGTWLTPNPYQYHVQYDTARLARIEGRATHLSNIPFGLRAYFGPGRIGFRESFPWIGLTKRGPEPGSATKIDFIEGYSSIPAAMPALSLLAVLGIAFAIQRRAGWKRAVLPIAVAAFGGASALLAFTAFSYRYVHDFYPFLVIPAILGAGAVPSISRKPLRVAVKALVIVAGIWSIAANVAFALRWQREDFWPDPVARAAFLRFRGRVDRLLPIGTPEPMRYQMGDEFGYLRKGQVLMVADPPGSYRYDGEQWRFVGGRPLHLFDLRVKFPLGHAYQRMLLWSAGHAGASDAVSIIYRSPSEIHFCAEHWGTERVCGTATDIEGGREYRLRINADRLNSLLIVDLNGQNVLQCPVTFYIWRNEDVLLGKSQEPSAQGYEFAGEIRRDEEAK
jgi:hypothetical protein